MKRLLGSSASMLVGFFLVIDLAIAGGHFSKEQVPQGRLSLDNFEEVSLADLNADPNAFLGKRISFEVKMIYKPTQIEGISGRHWTYGAFCPADLHNCGKEWLAVYLLPAGSQETLPALKNLSGVKKIFGTLKATPKGEKYLELFTARNVEE